MQLLKSKTNKVIFCFDGDAAGLKAAKASFSVAAPLLDESFSVDYVFLPEGYDPDSLLRQHGKVGMQQCLEGRLSLAEAAFSVFSADKNIAIPEGRAHVLAQVKPIVQSIPCFRVRENFCRAMQTALDLHELNIQEYMEI